MYCANCGTRLTNGSKFCSNCGTKVSASTPPPPDQQQYQQYQYHQYNNQTQAAPVPDMDNRWVWALATVPIFVSWLVDSIFFIFPIFGTIVCIILNIVFFTLDEKALKQRGIIPDTWLWLGIVLVPVYLFVRASKTDRNYAYAWVWCGMFLLGRFI